MLLTLLCWLRQTQAEAFLKACTHADGKPTEKCSMSEMLSSMVARSLEKLPSPKDRNQLLSSTKVTSQRLSSMEARCEKLSSEEDCVPVTLASTKACSQLLSSLKICSFMKPSSMSSYSPINLEMSTQNIHSLQRPDDQDLKVRVDVEIKMLKLFLTVLVKYLRLRNIR